jgi:hypothetical protein
VLLLVVLMPYYRNSFDSKAALDGLRVSIEQTTAQLDDVKERVEEESTHASSALLDAQAILARVAALQTRPIPRPTPQRPEPPAGEHVVAELDLVFIIDTTASMTPVLDQLTRSMASIVRILERLVPSVRIGVVAYRDHDSEPPIIRALPPTGTREDLPQILHFVASLRASRISSGTLQEAVFLGIQTATAFPLRPGARQALVVIGDAATHYRDLPACLAHVERFVAESPKRSVSGLFTSTRSSRAFGDLDRGFFVRVAGSGRGSFNDHAASMTESILLSVLVE